MVQSSLSWVTIAHLTGQLTQQAATARENDAGFQHSRTPQNVAGVGGRVEEAQVDLILKNPHNRYCLLAQRLLPRSHYGRQLLRMVEVIFHLKNRFVGMGLAVGLDGVVANRQRGSGRAG